jgi:hypothetical protein
MTDENKVPQFSAPKARVSVQAPIVVLHGTPGVGKSTLASTAPNALFMFTENGQRDLEVQTITDRPFETAAEFVAGLDFIGRGVKTGEFKNVQTLVVDSLDHLETLVINAVTTIYKERALADGFQPDAVAAITSFNEIPAKYNFEKWSEIDAQWQLIWKRIIRLRDLGVGIVGICHSHLRVIDDPASDAPYERHELKLDAKRAQKYWVDNADVIGFIHYPTVFDAQTKRTSLSKSPHIVFDRNASWMSKPNFGLTRQKLDNRASGFLDTFGAKIPFYAKQTPKMEQAK